MDGYSIKEAAELLGVPRRRVRELIASGVLLGITDRSGASRVHLKPPGDAPAVSTDAAHESTAGGATEEASPFRELLNEFRNLTERYGQALLALGEARGETAALRSRLDQLETHVDLRLPGPSATSVDWHAPVGATPAQPVEQEPVEATPDEHEAEEPPRRRGRRHAFSEFAEALARAEDPNAADLPEPVEASAAASLPDLELPQPEPAAMGVEHEPAEAPAEPAVPPVEMSEETMESEPDREPEAQFEAQAADAGAAAVEAEEVSFEAEEVLFGEPATGGETEAEAEQEALDQESQVVGERAEASAVEGEGPQPELELSAEADTEQEIQAQAADLEDQEVVPVEAAAFAAEPEPAGAPEIASIPVDESPAPIEEPAPPIEEPAPPIPSEPTILAEGPYSADLEEPDWIDEGEYTWLDAADVEAMPAQEAEAEAASANLTADDASAASVASEGGADEGPSPATEGATETPAVEANEGEVELMWLGAEREDGDRYAAELEVASFGQPPSHVDVAAERIASGMVDRTADVATPSEPASDDAPSDGAASDGAPSNELSRIAQDQGWDESEVEAIRSLLGGTPIGDTAPVVAPALDEQPVAQEERPPEPSSPPTWPRQDRVTRLTLPGARDLDDALAALRHGAIDEPTSGATASDASAHDTTARSEADATEPGEPRVEDLPSGVEQGSEGEPEWLRGRRDPAARAYRRLRRIFPS